MKYTYIHIVLRIFMTHIYMYYYVYVYPCCKFAWVYPYCKFAWHSGAEVIIWARVVWVYISMYFCVIYYCVYIEIYVVHFHGTREYKSIFAHVLSECSVLQCVAVCYCVLQCVTVCCSVLLCVAECYCVLQCIVGRRSLYLSMWCLSVVCCSVLQCVAVCCKCVAVCWNVLSGAQVIMGWLQSVGSIKL